jgi:hypothetical protein
VLGGGGGIGVVPGFVGPLGIREGAPKIKSEQQLKDQLREQLAKAKRTPTAKEAEDAALLKDALYGNSTAMDELRARGIGLFCFSHFSFNFEAFICLFGTLSIYLFDYQEIIQELFIIYIIYLYLFP